MPVWLQMLPPGCAELGEHLCINAGDDGEKLSKRGSMNQESRVCKEMIRVSLVDDHQLVRSGLRSLLEHEPAVSVVSEFSDGASFLDAYGVMEKADVLILDVSMPKAGGLEVLDQLSREKDSLSVIILSVHPEESHAVQAFIAGAKGYLNKRCACEAVLEAIICVANGGLYFSRRAQSMMFQDVFLHKMGADDLLSPKELLVFTGLCRGMSPKEIAGSMGISANSVNTYKERLMKKLKVKTLADIIRVGITRGI